MSEKPANPQAFPYSGIGGIEDVNRLGRGGMTLRDYFYAHAPITMSDAEWSLVDEGHSAVSHAKILTRLAKMRMAYADAMLSVRQEAANG